MMVLIFFSPNNRKPELITTLEETSEGQAFTKANFGLSAYRDTTGRELPAYLLTRDGFTLLAMGFTGAKAMQFKVAYISAFNRMEQLLKGGVSSVMLQNIEQRLEALEQTAGAGKAEAAGSISTIFLQALKDALTSGEYYIRDKWKKKKCVETGHLLGVIDGSRICVKCWQAYKIYSSITTTPVSNRILWGMLEEFKTIAPRAEAGYTRSIDKRKVSVIYIDADKLIK